MFVAAATMFLNNDGATQRQLAIPSVYGFSIVPFALTRNLLLLTTVAQVSPFACVLLPYLS